MGKRSKRIDTGHRDEREDGRNECERKKGKTDLTTTDEGPVDPSLTENSPQILHRKMFLRAYLTKLCSDPSEMDFWYYLDKVG